MEFLKSKRSSKNRSKNDKKPDLTTQTVDSKSTEKMQSSRATCVEETQSQTDLDSNVTKKEHLIKEAGDSKKTTENIFTKRYFNPVIDKKLTIILIENTIKLSAEKDKLIKFIKSNVSTGLISIIYYDSIVKKSEIFNVFNFTDFNLLSSHNIEDKICLYDALVELEILVSNSYMKLEKKEYEEVRINNIEIIGIGTCIDNCSKTSKEVAIDCFSRVARKHGITTKYYCLTDENFVQAAEIGFHSIGAIFRNYQQ